MLQRYLLLDLETACAPDAEQWLSPVEADKRLTDPAKIADDLAKKKAAQLETAPLDADLCQIVAFAMQPHNGQPSVIVTPNIDAEREVLDLVWGYTLEGVPLVGYGLTWFDLGVLVRRSQLLGVTVPARIYEQGKYRHPLIVELADYLTLNGMIEQKKGRGLDYHCKRLGIRVEDAHTGKDVASLWQARNFEGIANHARADLQRIQQLAIKLGVIEQVPETVLF